MATTSKRHKTPWPHGLPTVTCPVCEGSGMSRRAAETASTSRAIETKLEHLRCGTCSGRGRQVIDDPGSVQCKHKLKRRDCVICREGL